MLQSKRLPHTADGRFIVYQDGVRMQLPTVEALGADDIVLIRELEGKCFRTRWTVEQFRLGLERKAFHILGIRGTTGLLGYVAFSLIAGEMEIMNIGVDPEHRRKGFGAQLLVSVLRICREMTIAQGFLEVRRSNAAAIDLYVKFGFKQTGVRKGYYPDNGEDALLFALDFTSPGADHVAVHANPRRP